MPDAGELIDGLGRIANEWRPLAVFWHGYFAALVILLMAEFRPPSAVTGMLLSLPLLSVSVLAWVAANHFNGIVFALIGVVLIVLSTGRKQDSAQPAPRWMTAAGMAMFVFGWVYPHFLGAVSFIPYFYSAPTGLIPCPTLSIIIGLALMQKGPVSRAWMTVLAVTGVFYGLMGAVYLGVVLDWVLLAGALLLLIIASKRPGGSASDILRER